MVFEGLMSSKCAARRHKWRHKTLIKGCLSSKCAAKRHKWRHKTLLPAWSRSVTKSDTK